MPRLRLVPAALALVLAGAVVLGGCASDEDIDQARFATDLQKRTDITDDQANCLTEKIYAEFDQGEVNRIYHAATEAEVGGDTLETLDGFNAECITGKATDTKGDPKSDEGSDDQGDAGSASTTSTTATTSSTTDDAASTTSTTAGPTGEG